VGSDKINGIAILNEEMYVICADQNKVSVFQSIHPFKKFREFQLDALRCLLDIVSCAEEDCLFVSDWDQYEKGTVWRVSRDGNLMDKVATRIDFPVTLSVNSKQLIISNGKIINVYSPEQNVNTPPVKPQFEFYHVIKSSDGHFYTSSGGKSKLPGQGNYYRHDNAPQLVRKISSSGFVDAVFGELKSDPLQNLDEPNHLAFSAGNNIFVADRNHQQVLMISSDLKSSCRLLNIKGSAKLLMNPEGVYKPMRLHFDRASNRLFVGMSGGEWLRIDIYEVLE